jgi:anaerobic selenocysteine-containing dehydrogenase
MVPPASGSEADLSLPAAAFTETDGTTITYQGRVQAFRKAAPAPGEVRPSWQIICRLAGEMGIPGFNFASVEEVQEEIAGLVTGFHPEGLLDRSSLALAFPEGRVNGPSGWSGADCIPVSEHTYMGFPLTTWVEGLRLLVPDEKNHVSNH